MSKHNSFQDANREIQGTFFQRAEKVRQRTAAELKANKFSSPEAKARAKKANAAALRILNRASGDSQAKAPVKKIPKPTARSTQNRRNPIEKVTGTGKTRKKLDAVNQLAEAARKQNGK